MWREPREPVAGIARDEPPVKNPSENTDPPRPKDTEERLERIARSEASEIIRMIESDPASDGPTAVPTAFTFDTDGDLVGVSIVIAEANQHSVFIDTFAGRVRSLSSKSARFLKSGVASELNEYIADRLPFAVVD